jgi:predicted nucleotidyltransferase component of viral defense system
MAETKDVAASVRARLTVHARQQGRPFQEVLQYFAIERFLYRLAQSPFRSQFVLKGGVSFFAWGVPLRRPTRDIDFLGVLRGTVESVEAIVRQVCLQPVEADGMWYDTEGIRGEITQPHAVNPGIRVRFTGTLGSAKIPMQLDFNFSDTIVPPAIHVEYPTLLDMPAPQLEAYSYETMIAEKLQAMVLLGQINSRMKDFHDIWVLTNEASIDGHRLQLAIRATFEARGTQLPAEMPLSLSSSFAETKQQQWRAFVRRIHSQAEQAPEFQRVIEALMQFFSPVLTTARTEAPFEAIWRPGIGWETDL